MKFEKKVLQSSKLHLVFTRYSLVAGLSFIIDVLIFSVLYRLMHQTFIPLLIARLLSAFFNFYQNKYLVYRSMNAAIFKRELLHYTILAILVFLTSYIAIVVLTKYLLWPTIPVKIGIDFVLFLLNFIIQHFVFSGRT